MLRIRMFLANQRWVLWSRDLLSANHSSPEGGGNPLHVERGEHGVQQLRHQEQVHSGVAVVLAVEWTIL